MDLEKEVVYLLSLLVFLTYSTLYLYQDVFDKIPRDGDINEWMREVDHQTLLEFFNPLPQTGTTATTTYYRPIQKIIWKLQMDVWGEYSSNYRIYWILVHNTTVLMVYFFCRRLSLERGTAFLSSVLFSTLRTNVGVVKYEIAMAGHGVTAIFMMMSLIFFVEYLKKQSLKTYLLSFMFFTLSLLTSESSIVLLPLMILVQWTIHSWKNFELKKTLLIYSPFVLLSTILLFFSIMRYPTGAVANEWGGSQFNLYTLVRLTDYLTLLTYPLTQTENIKLVLLNLAFASIALALCRLKGIERFLVLWVIVCILPAAFSNFRPIEGLGRYLYIPSIGFAILTSKSITDTLARRGISLLSAYSLAFWIVNAGVVTGLISG